MKVATYCGFYKKNKNKLFTTRLLARFSVSCVTKQHCEFLHILQQEAHLASSAAWECDTQNSPDGVCYTQGLDGALLASACPCSLIQRIHGAVHSQHQQNTTSVPLWYISSGSTLCIVSLICKMQSVDRQIITFLD